MKKPTQIDKYNCDAEDKNVANNIKEQAMSFALAIENNAIKLVDIKQWADSLIKTIDKPSIELIETSISKTKAEALSALNKLSDGAIEGLSIQMLFPIFIQALNNKLVSPEQVSKALYFLAVNEQTPHPDAYEEMFCYWDDLDLANNGTYGNPQEVENNMLIFLSRYSFSEANQ